MGTDPKKAKKPSFFKVLIGDFTDKLKVPPGFVKNFRHKKLPCKIVWRSDKGHVVWNVGIEKTENGVFFAEGWPEFIGDAGFGFGDFLVFYLVDEETLEVVIYGSNCCEKPITATSHASSSRKQPGTKQGREQAVKVKAEDEETEGRANEEAVATSSTRPCFTKRLSKTRMSRVVILLPIAFARETGLMEKDSALIRDLVGRMWPVKVNHRSYSSYRRVELGTGWSDFIRANGLAAGDTIQLEYVGGKGNVIRAKALSRNSGFKRE